ncbi:LysR family transcriptional regulator [Yoonia sediminilitoris]|uniref:DNA-binding transcriptional LysR family regulator n=1 Tax=Yoonia sediminilitoris TaxID=1286148 RepID=A0A2T6KN42_9RHOB|nr:LysR family transcriptional regulator [Yoonia sediminilitoris]PUB17577.1 DNA-binding transcriptional LysR family regulator [Yoonia sediminilitoris]RCW97872.1 DNA-binding transcriptional LysR family regulator [Yoonia sediminilitoris]
MQIELIETFLDLCETKSFNQTADRLNITQSTVSGRIKSLEQTIGRRLFRRSRSGTSLTVDGLRFEPHARSLRHSWNTALQATRNSGPSGVSMRIGLQHDLVGLGFDRLIADCRAAMPDTAFYFEGDYSSQMCADLARGTQDLAVLYSPQTHPDIFCEAVAETHYVMVSTRFQNRTEIAPDSYILGNFAPAFALTHATLLPELSAVPLSVGQNAAMLDLLMSMNATGYVLAHSAKALVDAGHCTLVQGAPRITQPVYAGVNLRNRHRTPYKRLQKILRSHFSGWGADASLKDTVARTVQKG